MTAYVDTSALLKLYVDEDGSDDVWRWLAGELTSTVRVTWAEARAALARREREVPSAAAWVTARQRLAEDWAAIHIVEITQPLVERAGEFAEGFALRGYDAVQLAAAQVLRAALDEPVSFLSFDRRLNRAAKLLGLGVPEGAPL